MSELAKALILFHQTGASASKKARGAWGNYATIEDVIESVRKATDFGLTFTQEPDFELNANGEEVAFVRTVIMHSSGESRESRTVVYVPANKRGDPQRYGMGITYAKRYGLCAAFGLPTPDDDADGNSADASQQRRDNPNVDYSVTF